MLQACPLDTPPPSRTAARQCAPPAHFASLSGPVFDPAERAGRLRLALGAVLAVSVPFWLMLGWLIA